jgi:hypothetical protein
MRRAIKHALPVVDRHMLHNPATAFNRRVDQLARTGLTPAPRGIDAQSAHAGDAPIGRTPISRCC